MKQLLQNILLLLIGTFIGTLNSFSCSCNGEVSVSGSLKYSDAVFSGQIISRNLSANVDSLGILVNDDTSKLNFNWREFPIAIIKIKVDKIFKGDSLSDTLTIFTPSNGASCGFRFEVGNKYIVYGSRIDRSLINLKRQVLDKKIFWTNLCTRTQNWNTTEENDILKKIK